jgi:hypothetical protein
MNGVESLGTGLHIPAAIPTRREGATLLERVLDSLPADVATLHVSRQRAELPERVLIVDIDGTVSDPSHRRRFVEGPSPDWVKFSQLLHLDPPCDAVIAQLRRLCAIHTVILCSGRPSYVLDETTAWLDRNSVPYDVVALRPPGDLVPGIKHKLRVLDALEGQALMVVAIMDDDERVREEFTLRNVTPLEVP